MDIVFAKLPKHNFRKNLLKSGYWEKYEAVYKIAALVIYSTGQIALHKQLFYGVKLP